MKSTNSESIFSWFLQSQLTMIKLQFRFYFEGFVKKMETLEFRTPLVNVLGKLNSPLHDLSAKKKPPLVEIDLLESPGGLKKKRFLNRNPVVDFNLKRSSYLETSSGQNPYQTTKKLSSMTKLSHERYYNTASFSSVSELPAILDKNLPQTEMKKGDFEIKDSNNLARASNNRVDRARINEKLTKSRLPNEEPDQATIEESKSSKTSLARKRYNMQNKWLKEVPSSAFNISFTGLAW